MTLTKEQASELGKKSSRKGIPNKSTKEIREALQSLISSKLPELSKWLDSVADENPEKALNIIIKLSDFIIPKLQRIENINEMERLSPEKRKATIQMLKRKLINDPDY